MKKSIVNLSIVLMALVTSSAMQAYQWRMPNLTNKTLLIQLELVGSTSPYFFLVAPNQVADFSWPGGYCFGRIKYPTDSNGKPTNNVITALEKDGLIKNGNVVDNGKILSWLEKNQITYPRVEGKICYLAPGYFETPNAKKYQTPEEVDADLTTYKTQMSKASLDACSSRDFLIKESKNNGIIFITDDGLSGNVNVVAGRKRVVVWP